MKQIQVHRERSRSFLIGRNERSIRVEAMIEPFEMSSVVDLYLSDILPDCGIDLTRSPTLRANHKGWGPGTHPWAGCTFHHPTIFAFRAECPPERSADSIARSEVTAELRTDFNSWEGSSLTYSPQIIRVGRLRADVPFAYLGRVPCLKPILLTGGFEILTVSRWSNLVGAAPSPTLSFAIGVNQSRIEIELRTDKGVDLNLLSGLTEKLSMFFGQSILI